uniref:Uncharacterized protein n=1 Tax=Rhizophora mucronata TaxID=61149 RepID=A0A2P2NI63_RHIMU
MFSLQAQYFYLASKVSILLGFFFFLKLKIGFFGKGFPFNKVPFCSSSAKMFPS